MNRKFSEKEIDKLLSKYKFDNSEKNLQRLPLQREAHLQDLIRQGKYKEIKIKDFSELAPNFGQAAQDIKKHYEYYTAAAITVSSRVAIEGGMRPDDAFDLSDVLLRELEQAKTVDDVQQLFQITFYIFAKAVFHSRRQNNSYVIEQCKVYISRHIFQKITLNEIASYIGLNAKYVSRLFSRTENITLHDYIQREKVHAACNQLKYSDSSISSIAQYMGFQSQSHFGVVFKKWTGMTPAKYRNRNHESIFSNLN